MKLNQEKGNIGLEWMLSTVWFPIDFCYLKLQRKIQIVPSRYKGAETTKEIEPHQPWRQTFKYSTRQEKTAIKSLNHPSSSLANFLEFPWNKSTHFLGKKRNIFHSAKAFSLPRYILSALSVPLPLARIVTTPPPGCVNTEALMIELGKHILITYDQADDGCWKIVSPISCIGHDHSDRC